MAAFKSLFTKFLYKLFPALEPEKPSKEILKFLSEWFEWTKVAKIGDTCYTNPDHKFDTRFGLCGNIYLWKNRNIEVRYSFSDLLEKEFKDKYSYPFGGEELFDEENQTGTAHLNKKRLAWVNKILTKYGDSK